MRQTIGVSLLQVLCLVQMPTLLFSQPLRQLAELDESIGGLQFEPERVDAFFAAVNDVLEMEKARGAAYAFRGPGMRAPLLGTYGYTSAALDAPPVDADTAFMLASLSKPIGLGSAVGVLIDQGLIDLDGDICDVVGEVNYACRNPSYPDTPVTWRMLVTHRSSIQRDLPEGDDGAVPSYGPSGLDSFVGNPTCPIDDVEQFYEDLFLDKETETTVGNIGYNVNWYEFANETMGGAWNSSYGPGEVNAYSNMAAGYVPALIQKLTGEKFESFCQSAVFEAVGMNRTAWFRQDLPNNTLEAVPMKPYNNKTDTWEDFGHFCFADYGSGQLYSTVRDLSIYADVMLDYGIDTLWSNDTAFNHVFSCQEKDGNGNRMQDDDILCQNALFWFHLANAQRDSYGQDAYPSDQLDWTDDLEFLVPLDWSNGLEHSGAETGVTTRMIILPEAGLYAIILSNSEIDEEVVSGHILMEGMALLNETAVDSVNNFDVANVEKTGPDESGSKNTNAETTAVGERKVENSGSVTCKRGYLFLLAAINFLALL